MKIYVNSSSNGLITGCLICIFSWQYVSVVLIALYSVYHLYPRVIVYHTVSCYQKVNIHFHQNVYNTNLTTFRLRFETTLKNNKETFLNLLKNPSPTSEDAELLKKAITEVINGFRFKSVSHSTQCLTLILWDSVIINLTTTLPHIHLNIKDPRTSLEYVMKMDAIRAAFTHFINNNIIKHSSLVVIKKLVELCCCSSLAFLKLGFRFTWSLVVRILRPILDW